MIPKVSPIFGKTPYEKHQLPAPRGSRVTCAFRSRSAKSSATAAPWPRRRRRSWGRRARSRAKRGQPLYLSFQGIRGCPRKAGVFSWDDSSQHMEQSKMFRTSNQQGKLRCLMSFHSFGMFLISQGIPKNGCRLLIFGLFHQGQMKTNLPTQVWQLVCSTWSWWRRQMYYDYVYIHNLCVFRDGGCFMHKQTWERRWFTIKSLIRSKELWKFASQIEVWIRDKWDLPEATWNPNIKVQGTEYPEAEIQASGTPGSAKPSCWPCWVRVTSAKRSPIQQPSMCSFNAALKSACFSNLSEIERD